jgi:hypothetical protein
MRITLNVGKELAALERISVGELRKRYAELFNDTTAARNRKWLVKRIIWRMQSLEQGGCRIVLSNGPKNWPVRVTCGSSPRPRSKCGSR